MGGIIIIISILVPVLLFCDLTNINILILILTTVWFGTIGFLDDYIKVFKNKRRASTAGTNSIPGTPGSDCRIDNVLQQ